MTATTSRRSDVTTWTLAPSWPKPPLNMNDRIHYQAKAKIARDIRRSGFWLAREAGIPALVHADVTMIWTVPTRGRRDAENPVATLKPFCDGLVDAGICADDTPDLMTKHMPVIEYARGIKGVRFEVSGVAA